MAEKKGKRAVIISNIKSQSIEQAIFILKTPYSAPKEQAYGAGRGIIAEAQDIINTYIKTVEEPELNSRHKTSRRITVISALAAICAAAVSVFLYFV